MFPATLNGSGFHEDSLGLVFGEAADTFLINDLITSSGIYNHYRVPKRTVDFFSAQFPGAAIFHSTSLQLEQMNGTNEVLYCIIFHNSLKVILFKDRKLQIVQQFTYVTPEDVAYHLLNICERHSLKSAELQLRLTGMIDADSKLYFELYKYFLNIAFDNDADGIYSSDNFIELPAHFFSHLTSLAKCVS